MEFREGDHIVRVDKGQTTGRYHFGKITNVTEIKNSEYRVVWSDGHSGFAKKMDIDPWYVLDKKTTRRDKIDKILNR